MLTKITLKNVDLSSARRIFEEEILRGENPENPMCPFPGNNGVTLRCECPRTKVALGLENHVCSLEDGRCVVQKTFHPTLREKR